MKKSKTQIPHFFLRCFNNSLKTFSLTLNGEVDTDTLFTTLLLFMNNQKFKIYAFPDSVHSKNIRKTDVTIIRKKVLEPLLKLVSITAYQ